MEDFAKKARAECWDHALDCLGYSYIYSNRTAKIGRWLRWSKVLGFVTPVMLGGFVSGYLSEPVIMKWALGIATIVGLIQLGVSAVLTSLGSDEIIITYMRKAAEFNLLNSEFEQLAKFPLEDEQEYLQRYRILVERENGLSKDLADVKDEELRMGMRFGLRNYKRSCVKCEEVPFDMKPTKCPVCGNF